MQPKRISYSCLCSLRILAKRATRRTRVYFGRSGFGLTLLAAVLLVAHNAHGNGWEHSAIPFEALVKALDFEAPEMRTRAAQSLGFRGQPEAVEPLLQRLATPERNHLVRAAIYAALGNLADRRAVPVLSICLMEELREELRSECVNALGLIREKSSLPLILTALEKDSSVSVQQSAVSALGSFSEPAAVTKLSALVANSGHTAIRQRAISALGRTGSAAAVDPLLLALQNAESVGERILVVEALTGLQSRQAVKPLQGLLKESSDPGLRTRIVIALGAIDDGSTYPTLIEMLHDPVPAVRFFAVKSLHRQRIKEAAEPIGRLTLAISRHLEKQSAEELIEDPAPVLANLSFQVAAVQAIADLDAPGSLEALLAAGRSRSIPRDSAMALKIAEGYYQQRRSALYGLGYTKSIKAAAFLSNTSGIKDPDYRLRAVAARSIGVLGFSNAPDILIRCLEDPSAEVRWTAAAALGRLESKASVEPLLNRLSDENAEVRRQAALSLGFLADPRATSQLRSLASEDGSGNVRTAAEYSIRLLGTKP